MIVDVLRRIGGPSAVSLWALAALAPIAILGSLFSFGPQAVREHFWPLLGAAILSYLASSPVFIFAYLTYLSPSPTRPSRPLAALTTFALAGLLVGVTLSALVESFDIGIEGGTGAARAWLGLFWSSLIALVLDSSRRFRSVSNELSRSIDATTKLANQQVQAVSTLRSGLVENLKSAILAALERTTARDLNRLADDVIRPLRAELDKDLLAPSRAALSQEKIRWRPLLARSLREPSAPLLTALLASAAGLVATVTFLNLATLLDSLIVFVLLWLNLELLRRLKLKSAVVSFLLLLGGAIVGAFVGQVLQSFAPEQAASLGNLNLGSWAITIFLGLQFTLEQGRREKLVEMKVSLEQLRWQRSKLEQVVWAETRRLSKFIHSDIQGRIRAAAIRSANLSLDQLDELRSECMDALDSAIDTISFREFLDQSERVWEGILNIRTAISPGVESRLEIDGFAKAAAVEVIREGLCNAVRHGHASHVSLALAVSNDGDSPVLRVAMLNDGEPFTEATHSGFGSEILDEASSEWSLANTDQGVELVATIPLSRGSH